MSSREISRLRHVDTLEGVSSLHLVVWTENSSQKDDILNMVNNNVWDAVVLTCNSIEEFQELAIEKSSLLLLVDIDAFSQFGSALQEVLLSPDVWDNVYVLVLASIENIDKLSNLDNDCYDDFMVSPFNDLELNLRLQRGVDKLPFKSYHKEQNPNSKHLSSSQFNDELENARRVHERSLPRYFPSIEDVSLAAYYRPAAHLGGDYYNFFKVDHGALNILFEHYLFYLSDVMGHGLDSTVLSIFVKDTINSYFSFKHAEGELVSPALIMDYLVREYLDEGFPGDYFVCLFLGVLDIKASQIIYSTAGFQFSPLVFRESGEMWEAEIGGMPVSAALMPEMMKYEERALDIEQGMTILFSTDGLFEQESSEGEAYESRLKDMFAEKGYLPPELLVQIIENDLCQFAGESEINDDVTFMLVQFHPEDYTSDYMVVNGVNMEEQLETIDEKIHSFLHEKLGNKQAENLKSAVDNSIELLNRVSGVENEGENTFNQQLEVNWAVTSRYFHLKVKGLEVGQRWKENVADILGFPERQKNDGWLFMQPTKYFFDYIFLTRKENEVNLVKLL